MTFKFLLFVLLLSVSTGSQIEYLKPKIVNLKTTQYVIKNKSLGFACYIFKVTIDGHEYFVIPNTDIKHTANCQCRKEK